MQLIILSRTREKMTYFAVRRNFFSKKMFRIAPLDGTGCSSRADWWSPDTRLRSFALRLDKQIRAAHENVLELVKTAGICSHQ